MGETSKVGISASKVVALIATLILIRDSIFYFYTTDVLAIIFGIVGLVIAFVVWTSLGIIDMKKLFIPYYWWLLLIIGLFLVLVEYLVGPNYLAGLLMITAALLEFLSQKKPYPASRVVALIGACYAIYEAISAMLFGGNIGAAIVALIFAIVLILTMTNIDIKIPYTWWVVLIIGFVIFTWAYQVSGTVIMVAFILILMAY